MTGAGRPRVEYYSHTFPRRGTRAANNTNKPVQQPPSMAMASLGNIGVEADPRVPEGLLRTAPQHTAHIYGSSNGKAHNGVGEKVAPYDGRDGSDTVVGRSGYADEGKLGIRDYMEHAKATREWEMNGGDG